MSIPQAHDLETATVVKLASVMRWITHTVSLNLTEPSPSDAVYTMLAAGDGAAAPPVVRQPLNFGYCSIVVCA